MRSPYYDSFIAYSMGKGEHFMTRDEFIKYKIKEKGFTLKDYAKFIGMPYSSLLSMLSGNLGGASLENVIKICNGLGISLSCLQKRDGISEDLPWELNEQEKTLINNYRARPMMQPAVNKLLDLEE